MNTPEDDPEETLKGINAADLLARGLESAKAATGNPQAWQPPTPEELAVLLPQYEIESLLGRGGMGAVYRGKQAALDRAVAIKLLPAELAADAEFMNRFQREARTLARLQHPGIVAVHDFGQTSEGHLYFVMEFVNGTDLARLIHGPGINPVQALEVITQICDALQYAHSQGVIHRDIKPANVLINTEGRAKLADFGLARPTSEETASLTRSNVVMGTPDYMAPEQMAGNADHRADLYALGVMLYEMLTGQTPRGAWAPPSQRVQVDVRLDQVVVRALQQDPAMRYQQASEIKTDVDVIRTTPLPKAGKAKAKLASEAPGQRTTPLPKAKKPVNRVAWAAAIVLPLLAVVGWWTAQNQKTPSSPASAVPWQRVERTAEQWAKTGQTLKDGWVHSPNKSILLFDRLTPALATSQFAFRTKIIFDDKESRLSLANTNGGGSQMRAVAFWPNKQNVSTRNPAATQRHPATVAPGEEAYVEILVAGDKAYTRFNHGGVVEVDLSPLIPWEQGYLLSDKSYSLRDIEYAILDGIPDPLKALGWEVPPTPVPQAQTLPWLLVEAKGKNWDLGKLTKKDGWVEMTEGVAWTKPDRAFKAIAFRVHYQWKGDGSLSLKRLNNTQPSVSLTLWPKELKLFTRSLTPDLKQADQNTSFTEPLRQGHEGTLELAVVGERMLARLDGRLMFVGDQPGLPPTAFIEVNGENVRVRDFQYAILDGIPDPLKALGWEVTDDASSKPVAAASQPPWQTLARSDPEWNEQVFSLQDEWIRFKVSSAKPYPIRLTSAAPSGNPGLFKDAAIQVRYRWNPDAGANPQLILSSRSRSGNAGVEAELAEREIRLRVDGTAKFDKSWPRPKPLKPGDEGLFELAAVGQRLIVRLNGETVLAEDHAEMNRTGGLSVQVRGCGLREIKHVNLNGIADPLKALGWEMESVASGPATATKEKPFTNSLGMKFVPVPGTDILMCIHETRRKDYAAYADLVPDVDATWKNPLDEGKLLIQDDNHPVVEVSWEDASAFCAWLSKKEGRTYRLPTEREWNLAAAFDVSDPRSISDTDLKALMAFPKPQYPWGTRDEKDANGNYKGKEDGHEGMAPVMSFLPNRLGIFDLGGNAWEWCDSWFDKQKSKRVLIGCGYMNYGGYRNSLTRLGRDPDFRFPVPPLDDYSRNVIPGFRCVLKLPADERTAKADTPKADIAPKNGVWKKAVWHNNALPYVSADGWFSVGNELRQFDPRTSDKQVVFRDGAVRAQVRLTTTPSSFPPGIGFWLRQPMDQSVSFGISELELVAKRNDGTPKPVERGRIIFDTPFLPGDVERFEAAVVGDTFIVRFKGKELRFQDTQAVQRSGPVTIHGRNYGVKDVEYAILDGISDPLKALGWDFAEAKPRDEAPWRDFLAELTDGPHKNSQLGHVWTKEGAGWRVKSYHTFMIPDDAGRDLAIRATGTGYLGVFARDNGKSNCSGRLFASTGFAKIQRSEEVLKQFKLGPNFDPAKPHRIELITAVNTLRLLVDDVELGSVQDEAIVPGGRFGVTAAEGSFVEKVEYRFLAAPAKTSSTTTPAPTQREIAERLLGLKAELRIRQPGKLTRVIFGDKLPESDFAIYEITFPMTAQATDETFALVAGVPDLERLRVNGRISTLSPVAGLNKLIELNIYSSGSDPDDGNPLSEEEMRHLEGLTQLESLTMGIKGFTGQGCRHLRGAAKLTKLFLGQKGETARPIDEAGAAVIARLTSLTSLSLRGNVFAPASSAAFRTIVAMPNLTTLDLGETTITREMLLEIGKMPKLQSLNLSTCRLETQEFSLLAPCAGHLTALSFGYDTDLSDAGVKEIADTLVNLKEFILGWTNACTGASLRELARLPKLHDFRYQKRDGLINPEDFEALSHFPVLNQLSLVSCGLTDDYLKPLGRCPNLAAVTLTSNDQITDAALAHLHASKTLRYVEVTGTKVTDAGIAALKQALPGCEVKK